MHFNMKNIIILLKLGVMFLRRSSWEYTLEEGIKLYMKGTKILLMLFRVSAQNRSLKYRWGTSIAIEISVKSSWSLDKEEGGNFLTVGDKNKKRWWIPMYY